MTGDAAGDGQDVVTARVLLPKAAAVFTGLVHEVPADGWAAPTPCAQWSVRDLVAHLTREHLWVPDLLAGRTVEVVGDADLLLRGERHALPLHPVAQGGVVQLDRGGGHATRCALKAGTGSSHSR